MKWTPYGDELTREEAKDQAEAVVNNWVENCKKSIIKHKDARRLVADLAHAFYEASAGNEDLIR